MKRILVVLVTSVAVMASAAQGQDIAGELKTLVIRNLRATQKEDLRSMMATLHTQSPVYLLTKEQTRPVFDNYDLRYELLSFKYLATDGAYAFARIRQQTTKKSGLAFKNNEIDMIQVFRKEGPQWKYWNQVILEIDYIK